LIPIFRSLGLADRYRQIQLREVTAAQVTDKVTGIQLDCSPDVSHG
jgi:hypothetical protein